MGLSTCPASDSQIASYIAKLSVVQQKEFEIQNNKAMIEMIRPSFDKARQNAKGVILTGVGAAGVGLMVRLGGPAERLPPKVRDFIANEMMRSGAALGMAGLDVTIQLNEEQAEAIKLVLGKSETEIPVMEKELAALEADLGKFRLTMPKAK